MVELLAHNRPVPSSTLGGSITTQEESMKLKIYVHFTEDFEVEEFQDTIFEVQNIVRMADRSVKSLTFYLDDIGTTLSVDNSLRNGNYELFADHYLELESKKPALDMFKGLNRLSALQARAKKEAV
jgi:hypothetical protein